MTNYLKIINKSLYLTRWIFRRYRLVEKKSHTDTINAILFDGLFFIREERECTGH